MDAEINNVIYMELYSGPKMVCGKYGKTNLAGSIDRDSAVQGVLKFKRKFWRQMVNKAPFRILVCCT
jgi:hypothetical protein